MAYILELISVGAISNGLLDDVYIAHAQPIVGIKFLA